MFVEVSSSYFAASLLKSLGALTLLPVPIRQFGPLSRLGAAGAIATASCLMGEQESCSNGLLVDYLQGMLIVLPLFLSVHLIEGVGSIFDATRGQSLRFFYDSSLPESSDGQTPLGGLFRAALWLLIIERGFLRTVFETMMMGAEHCNNIYSISQKFTAFTLHFVEWSLSLALPIMVLLLLVDLFVGVVSRIVPGLQLTAEAFSLKTILLFLLLISPGIHDALFSPFVVSIGGIGGIVDGG